MPVGRENPVTGWTTSSTGFRCGDGRGDGLCTSTLGREGTSLVVGAMLTATLALWATRRRRRR